jgi:type IV conjugative transfer system coupling protein TraD
MFKHIIRGGQTNLHSLRMIKQIISMGVSLSFFLAYSYSGVKIYQASNENHWNSAYHYYLAQSKLFFSADKNKVIQIYSSPYISKSYKRQSISIIRDRYIVNHTNQLKGIFKQYLFIGFILSIVIFAMIMIMWWIFGKKHRKPQHERGVQFLSSHKLKSKLKKEKIASDLNLDGFPLIKGKETSHILLTGTTGSGKSNAIYKFLDQIRARKQPGIIVDFTGDYVSRYYREGDDYILNPLDERSTDWSPWAECNRQSHFESFANAILPEQLNTGDKFWDNAARTLLSVALQKLREEGKENLSELLNILLKSDSKKFEDFFAGTEAAPISQKKGDKLTLSIRSIISTNLRFFQYIKDTDQAFSIRDWIKNPEDKWLFITCKADQKDTLISIITAWIDIAVNTILSLEPDEQRRFWFVLDELPSLKKISSLQYALAESRKFGACILAGIQNIDQIISIYGQHGARSMLDLFNTKIFFRTTDPNTTSWISKVLGEQEIKEFNEGLSYGANQIRDGVNMNRQTRTKAIITPSEIANLPDLSAYIKLPGSLPVTQINMKYSKPDKIHDAFVERNEVLQNTFRYAKDPLALNEVLEKEPDNKSYLACKSSGMSVC